MSKTVKFTKPFGKFKVGDTKKFSDRDAFALTRFGVAEVEGVEVPAYGTRMLTAAGGGNERRNRTRGTSRRAATKADDDAS